MWYNLGKWILKFRLLLLVILLVLTGVMAYYASKIQMSYEFTRAIPIDNPKYQEYQAFKQKFGEDGSMIVLGVETKDFYKVSNFNALIDLQKSLKKVAGVE